MEGWWASRSLGSAQCARAVRPSGIMETASSILVQMGVLREMCPRPWQLGAAQKCPEMWNRRPALPPRMGHLCLDRPRDLEKLTEESSPTERAGFWASGRATTSGPAFLSRRPPPLRVAWALRQTRACGGRGRAPGCTRPGKQCAPHAGIRLPRPWQQHQGPGQGHTSSGVGVPTSTRAAPTERGCTPALGHCGALAPGLGESTPALRCRQTHR